MSGVVGLWDERGVDVDLLTDLLSTLDYRGTAGREARVYGTVGVGYQRFPTGDGGRPRPVELGDVVVVLDGRVDNRRSLVRELSTRNDASDPRLLASAYREWGPEFLRYVTGPFALVLWDRRTDRMLVARDKVGIRHVYYAADDDLFLAGSEARTLTHHPDVNGELDHETITAYLSGNLSSPGDTFYADVTLLEPGTYLLVDDCGLTHDRYWAPWRRSRLNRPPASSSAALTGLVWRAVTRRLRASVRPAVSMSGGLDSTVVASVAHRVAVDRPGIATPPVFTVTFDDLPDIDERTTATATARENDLKQEIVDGRDLWPLKRDLRSVLDSPCRDTSLDMFDEIAHTAVESGRRSLFTGIGGNLFDGDRSTYADLLRSGRVLEFARQARLDDHSLLAILVLSGVLPGTRVGSGGRSATGRGSRISVAGSSAGLQDARNASLARKVLDPYMDFARDALRRTALLNGVEVYHPLLDPTVVSFLFELPAGHLFGEGRHKHLFRETFAGVVPGCVLEQSVSDNGYGSYLRRGLKTERDLVRDALEVASTETPSSVPTDAVERLSTDVGSTGDHRGTDEVWRTVTTGRWLDAVG